MPDVPEKFKKFQTAAGVFRKFDKVLFWGPPKVGKSRGIFGFPGPRLVIDVREGGCQMYAEPDDVILTMERPKDIVEAWEWGCSEAKKGTFATLALDSGTGFWERTRDEGTEPITKAGKDVRFQDWASIKKPSNKFLDLAMRVPANVVVTAWQKETVADESSGAFKPKKVDLARIEGKFPYLFDYMFSLDQEDDALGRPTGKYQMTFIGGRVPPTVPAGSIYPGKTWAFPAKGSEVRTAKQVYDEVIGWLRPYKEAGGVPTLMGLDEEQYQKSWEELENSITDEAVGKVIRLLQGITSPAQWRQKTIELSQITTGLGGDSAREIQKLVDRKRADLGLL